LLGSATFGALAGIVIGGGAELFRKHWRRQLTVHSGHTLYSNQDTCRKTPAAIPNVRGDFESVSVFSGRVWRYPRPIVQAKGKFEDIANGAMGEAAWPIIDNQIRSRTKRMMAFIVTSR
jgi:hypothetical protein